MKGSLSRLLCALLLVSSAYAKTNTGKTHMLPRSQGVNLAMEYPTWHRHLNTTNEDRIGGSIQVVPFYQESADDSKYGKYFGVKFTRNGNADNIDDFVGVVRNGVAGASEVLNPLDVFHISIGQANNDPAGANTPRVANWGALTDDQRAQNANLTLRDEVQIRPESKSVGARIDYHQKLDCLLKGLFFKVNVPVVNNKTSVRAKTVKDATSTTQQLAVALADIANLNTGANTGAAKSMLDYLAGNVSNTDAVNAQVALTKAKIVGGSHSKTGVADVDLMLGYMFLREENYRVGINVGVTFPTGNKPNGEYLFEPRVGVNHWGVGAGFDTMFRMWHSDCCELELLLVGNYRYLFKDKEIRTGGTNLWTQYKLGDKTNAAAGDAFFPLANVLTTEFDVTPGSQFDMIVDLAFTWKGFIFDLGYNLYVRSDEHASVRNWNATAQTYVVANRNSKTDVAFGAVATNAGGGGDIPNGTVLRSAAANGGPFATADAFNTTFAAAVKTPSQFTNKIYASAGYSWDEWEYPVLLGVFGGYEFSDNAALEQWNVGGKVGVTF